MTRLRAWLDSCYGSRDGDQDPESRFINLGWVVLLNIHDCKCRSIDGCAHTMFSIHMDLQMYFHTGSLRLLCSKYENAYHINDYILHCKI